MSPDFIEAARIETKLMREHLASPDVRPALEDSVWVADVPCGPKLKGIQQLQRIQERYGFVNVTTANASPWGRGDLCGVYVRKSATENAENPLRYYLAR